jgi:cytochrome bd-type quinol oxidase subunit 2
MTFTIPRTALGVGFGLVTAGVAAWSLGGRLGSGVLLGYLLGASAALVGALWQVHWARRSPQRAMRAQMEALLFKLPCLLVFALFFRYVAPAAEAADWRVFLVGFAAAVCLVLPLAAWDTHDVLRRPDSGTLTR